MQQNYSRPKKRLRLSARALWTMAIVGVAVILVIDACKRNSEVVATRQARGLYEESIQLLTLYSDSLANVADSVGYSRLKETFEDRIAKLNFHYPPDTDLDVTEQENDSLYQAFQRYVAVRDSRLSQLAEKKRALTDTVAMDSLSESPIPL